MPGALPTTKAPAQTIFGLEYNTVVQVSPLTKKEERLELPGARWKAVFTYPPLVRADADELLGFIAKQRGSLNTFTIIDPVKKTPRGTALGAGVVNGASQTGTSLITDGWTASQTGLFKTGDYFGFGTEMKMMTQDINSDGSGNATLVFEPAIRLSPSDNATIITSSVPVTVRLLDDEGFFWQMSVANHFGLKLEMVEAI